MRNAVLGRSKNEGEWVLYLGPAFELHPVDVVDVQGFPNQVEGIWVLTEHQALLLWDGLAQPHKASHKPLDLAHPVAHNSYLQRGCVTDSTLLCTCGALPMQIFPNSDLFLTGAPEWENL